MGVMDVLARLAKKNGRKGKTKVSCEGTETQTASLTTKKPFVVTSLVEASKEFARTGGQVGVKGDVEGLTTGTTFEVTGREAAALIPVYANVVQTEEEGEAWAVACGAIVDAAKQKAQKIKERAETLLASVLAMDATNGNFRHVGREELQTAATLISEDVEAGKIEPGEMAGAFRALIEKEFPRPADGESKPKGKTRKGKGADRAEAIDAALNGEPAEEAPTA